MLVREWVRWRDPDDDRSAELIPVSDYRRSYATPRARTVAGKSLKPCRGPHSAERNPMLLIDHQVWLMQLAREFQGRKSLDELIGKVEDLEKFVMTESCSRRSKSIRTERS